MSFIEKYNIDENFVIKDLDTLKKMTHPQRIEILQSLHSPKTVKEIAEEIQADPTKLYYHIRQMEQSGLIKVVETNMVSGIVEKTYFVTAKNYTVDKNLFAGEQGEASEEDFSNLIGAMFSSTQQQAKRSAKAGLINLNDEESQQSTILMSTMYSLTDEQLSTFHERLRAVLDEFGEMAIENAETKNKASKDYLFTMAFFRKPPSEVG
ncbi:MAG: DNA-binding transcriptional ArsR family regulator [Cellvibrionaceae bacterium]|jgi:DNA-binding transcriptional ArsR family regulator